MRDFIINSVNGISFKNPMIFLLEYTCLPMLVKSNISILVSLMDALILYFVNFCCFFIIKTWSQLLQQYSDKKLYIYFIMLLYFEYLLVYIRLDIFIL